MSDELLRNIWVSASAIYDPITDDLLVHDNICWPRYLLITVTDSLNDILVTVVASPSYAI